MKPARPYLVAAAAAVLVTAAALLAAGPAWAATIAVAAEAGRLRAALASAAAGDVLALAPGIHDGPIVVDRPVTLLGQTGAVIDGHFHGRTIEVRSPGVAIRGLTVRNSGADDPMDAGIFLEQSATGAVVEDDAVLDNLVGVFVHGAANAVVRDNRIAGRTDLRLNDRGNGVYVWNAPGARIIGNDISGGRDGIFTNASRANVFRGNRMRDVRFAIHYMYTNDSEISDNVSIGNHGGYAVMFSDRLRIVNNTSSGDRDFGLLFNYANDADISANSVDGGHKCLFIYNANKNAFRNNVFRNCDIGVHFTAGSERNAMTGNAFIANRTQVMYVGTRSLDWSVDGRGNYWSDDPAFDLNGDGIADAPYRPNDMVDQILWAYPAAKLLLNSPALQVLRWAQSQFPALHPGGVIDSAPLMRPPTPPRKLEAAGPLHPEGG